MAPKRDWVEDAACRGELFPDAWFLDKSGDPEHDQPLRQARRICALRCTVRLECLEAGMSEDYGVWGGVTERARKRLMRRLPDPPKEMTSSVGSARRIRAMAHLGWSTADIAIDVRRYSGVSVGIRYLEEVRDEHQSWVSEELHEALARSFKRNRSRFNSKGNTANTVNLAQDMKWPTARAWRGIDIDDPEAKPGHDEFA